MTGKSDLCVLVDGVLKRFPTAEVELDIPYFSGQVKGVCKDD